MSASSPPPYGCSADHLLLMNNSQLHPVLHKPPHYTFFPPSNTQQTKKKEINERKKKLGKKNKKKGQRHEEGMELRMKKKKKNNNDSAGRRSRPDWSCKLNAVVGFFFSTFNETASSVFLPKIFELIGAHSLSVESGNENQFSGIKIKQKHNNNKGESIN